MLLAAPPSAPTDFEVLFDAEIRAAFYSYNDILLRRTEVSSVSSEAASASSSIAPAASLVDDPSLNAGGLGIDPSVVNGSRVYLQVDGYPTLGPALVQGLPRAFIYGATPFYACLHLGSSLGVSISDRPDMATCRVYDVPEGEAMRRITLLRRRWPHEIGGRGEGPSGGEGEGGVAEQPTAASADDAVAGTDCSRSRSSSHASDAIAVDASSTVAEAKAASAAAQLGSRRQRTLLALSAAASLQEDAEVHVGRCVPGGMGVRAAPTPADAERDATLEALLGFPGELDA